MGLNKLKEEILTLLDKNIYSQNDKLTEAITSLEVLEGGIKIEITRKGEPMAEINSFKKLVISEIEKEFPAYKDRISVITKDGSVKPVKDEKQKLMESSFIYKAKNIIGVYSGKGGVGKSTISVNIAVALAQKGYKVGFLDADIYGPSAPLMFGIEEFKPVQIDLDGFSYIEPAIKSYGDEDNKGEVRVMSVGFFYSTDNALAWRGPIATGALKQILHQTLWEELDFLIIDFPPGTGDIQLSLLSEIPDMKAIIITTPQKIALNDVERGIALFRNSAYNVNILGVVENMSYFIAKEMPENRYYIFGKDGAKEMCEKLDIPLLGSVPLVAKANESMEIGEPLVLIEPLVKESINEILKSVLKAI